MRKQTEERRHHEPGETGVHEGNAGICLQLQSCASLDVTDHDFQAINDDRLLALWTPNADEASAAIVHRDALEISSDERNPAVLITLKV